MYMCIHIQAGLLGAQPRGDGGQAGGHFLAAGLLCKYYVYTIVMYMLLY